MMQRTRRKVTARSRARAAAVATGVAMILVLAGYGLLHLGSAEAEGDHRHGGDSEHSEEVKAEQAGAHDLGHSLADLRLGLRDSHPAVRARAVNELADRVDTESVTAIIGLLDDNSTAVRENAARALGTLNDQAARMPLGGVLQRTDEDEWVRLHAAGSLARLGDPSGLIVLLEIARSADAGLARRTALADLLAFSGSSRKPGDDDAASLSEIREWLAEHGTTLAWDPEASIFRPGIGR